MARRFLSFLLLISLTLSISPLTSARASGVFQGSVDANNAQQMLNKMTPEERVGQLFLVSFTGSSANDKSQIYDLITNHHVGGVVLRAENDNFVAAPDTVSTAYQLIAQLQDAELQASLNQQPTSSPNNGTPTPSPLPAPTTVPANYIPLFAGISQEGTAIQMTRYSTVFLLCPI